MPQHASDDRAASPQARPPDRASRPLRGAVSAQPATAQAQALALQRLAGNRATAATLARWAAHPDPAKKGVMLPDVVAAEYVRFNPPQNS